MLMLVILGVLLATQQAVRFQQEANGRQQQLALTAARLEDQLEISQQQLHAVRRRAGLLWDGTLHEPLQDTTASMPVNPDMLMSQERIVSSVPLNPEGTLTAQIDLHECNPGSQICTSGGMIELTNARGAVFCSIELNILSVDAGRYEFSWTTEADGWTEAEKIDTIASLAGPDTKCDRETFQELLASLYQTGNADSPEFNQQRKRLVQVVLRQALNDRFGLPPYETRGT